MPKLLLVVSVLCSIHGYGQQDFFILKKRHKTIRTYRQGFTISFQTNTGGWLSGNITKIQNDSFFVKPLRVIYHLMGADTLYSPVLGFALTDVMSIPNKGIKIDYIDGQFRVNGNAGHVHWYWIKSGWLFRTLGAGYAGLHIVNGALNDNFSFSAQRLGIAAGVFLLGKSLRHAYKYRLVIEKKYHLQFIKL